MGQINLAEYSYDRIKKSYFTHYYISEPSATAAVKFPFVDSVLIPINLWNVSDTFSVNMLSSGFPVYNITTTPRLDGKGQKTNIWDK